MYFLVRKASQYIVAQCTYEEKEQDEEEVAREYIQMYMVRIERSEEKNELMCETRGR